MLYKYQVLSYYYHRDLNWAGGPRAAFTTPPAHSQHWRDGAGEGKLCFPRSLAAWEIHVLGQPPYRNPLKIPTDVYLALDTVLLPTGSACATGEKLGTSNSSSQLFCSISSGSSPPRSLSLSSFLSLLGDAPPPKLQLRAWPWLPSPFHALSSELIPG